jgi:lactate dehydrogenase-like 2-hydroxyacid dehydrogenase
MTQDMAKVTVLVNAPLPAKVMAALAERFDLVKPFGDGVDRATTIAAAAGRIRGLAQGGHARVDEALLAQLPALEIVANLGVGYDAVDAAAAAKRGVVVTNTPDVLTEEVADTALGLLLMTVRELSAAERYLRDGKWLGGGYPLTPGTLRGRTLGILGLGRIGQAIARRAQAFGLPVAYHNRRKAAGVDLPYHPTLVGLAEAVDTLIVVVPGGAATHHLVDAAVLKALGSDGILINIGRGSTVDEAALVQALNDGTILAAGLDVFEHEPCWPKALMEAPRTVLLPHVASASVATRAAMGQLMVDNLTNWFAEGRPLTPVAETPWPRG